VLLIDTAGRLQNKAGLMAELEKIVRVLRKQDPDAPHATLLVLDATVGSERAQPGRGCSRRRRRHHRAGDDQARRHRARRHPGGAGGEVRPAGALHRRRRGRRGPGALRGPRLRPGDRRTGEETVLQLDEEGWRKLTFRWGLFFFVLAALNEIVWRTQTQDFWVAFKVWGVMPLTMAFALAQTPLILKHEIKPAVAAGE
jgi:hypothetical protein